MAYDDFAHQYYHIPPIYTDGVFTKTKEEEAGKNGTQSILFLGEPGFEPDKNMALQNAGSLSVAEGPRGDRPQYISLSNRPRG